MSKEAFPLELWPNNGKIHEINFRHVLYMYFLKYRGFIENIL